MLWWIPVKPLPDLQYFVLNRFYPRLCYNRIEEFDYLAHPRAESLLAKHQQCLMPSRTQMDGLKGQAPQLYCWKENQISRSRKMIALTKEQFGRHSLNNWIVLLTSITKRSNAKEIYVINIALSQTYIRFWRDILHTLRQILKGNDRADLSREVLIRILRELRATYEERLKTIFYEEIWEVRM